MLSQLLAGPNTPEVIRQNLAVVHVRFHTFNGQQQLGQLVVHKALATEVVEVFDEIYAVRFPIEKIVPLSVYNWSDDASMADNNTSAFNFRRKVGKPELSHHAYGCAIDINPRLNPYIKGELVLPPGACYEPTAPGTITAHGPVVRAFEQCHWIWGGRWEPLKDWHHFEKPLEQTNP
ncbi:MAG: M15 family metallopeptidase [Abitibacteriaceae bacterium]|nr:M15 family metallopeptidase [Abditibacteriaceae bacterium]